VIERDPIDDLRDAWRGVEPTPIDERAAAHADRLGERATERLRDAWRGLQAPAPRVPRPHVAVKPALAFRATRWTIAAGLAGVALYGTWRAITTRGPAKFGRTDAGVVALAAPHEDVRSIPLAALSRDSMELRYGSVRLLLFESTTLRAPSTTTETMPGTQE
jgi:hypothetical protein